MPDRLDALRVCGDRRLCFKRLSGDLVITVPPSPISDLGRLSVRIVRRGRYTADGISVCRDHGFGTARLSRLVLRSDTSVGARDDLGEAGVFGSGNDTVRGESGAREARLETLSLSAKDFFRHSHHRRFSGVSTCTSEVFQGIESVFGVGFRDGRRQRRYCNKRTMLLRCNTIDARKLTGMLRVPSPLNTKLGIRSDCY